MIGKIMKNHSFYDTCAYVLGKEGASVIGGNMAGKTLPTLAQEFSVSQFLNSKVKRPVYHVAIAVEQQEQLDDDTFREIGDKYIERIGLDPFENQYLMVRHADREHAHIHIVASRVNLLSGKAVKTWRDHYRNQVICRQLEQEYGLRVLESAPLTLGMQRKLEEEHGLIMPENAPSKGRKSETLKQRKKLEQTGLLPTKTKLQNIIEQAAIAAQHGAVGEPNRATMPELIRQLQRQGVTVRVTWRTDRKATKALGKKIEKVLGISYSLDNVAMSGNNLGAWYTFPGLQKHRSISYDKDRDDADIKDAIANPVPAETSEPANDNISTSNISSDDNTVLNTEPVERSADNLELDDISPIAAPALRDRAHRVAPDQTESESDGTELQDYIDDIAPHPVNNSVTNLQSGLSGQALQRWEDDLADLIAEHDETQSTAVDEQPNSVITELQNAQTASVPEIEPIANSAANGNVETTEPDPSSSNLISSEALPAPAQMQLSSQEMSDASLPNVPLLSMPTQIPRVPEEELPNLIEAINDQMFALRVEMEDMDAAGPNYQSLSERREGLATQALYLNPPGGMGVQLQGLLPLSAQDTLRGIHNQKEDTSHPEAIALKAFARCAYGIENKCLEHSLPVARPHAIDLINQAAKQLGVAPHRTQEVLAGIDPDRCQLQIRYNDLQNLETSEVALAKAEVVWASKVQQQNEALFQARLPESLKRQVPSPAASAAVREVLTGIEPTPAPEQSSTDKELAVAKEFLATVTTQDLRLWYRNAVLFEQTPKALEEIKALGIQFKEHGLRKLPLTPTNVSLLARASVEMRGLARIADKQIKDRIETILSHPNTYSNGNTKILQIGHPLNITLSSRGEGRQRDIRVVQNATGNTLFLMKAGDRHVARNDLNVAEARMLGAFIQQMSQKPQPKKSRPGNER